MKNKKTKTHPHIHTPEKYVKNKKKQNMYKHLKSL